MVFDHLEPGLLLRLVMQEEDHIKEEHFGSEKSSKSN